MTVTRDAEVGEVSRQTRRPPPGGRSMASGLRPPWFLALAMVPAVVSGYPVYILPQYMLFGMLALSLVLSGASSAS